MSTMRLLFLVAVTAACATDGSANPAQKDTKQNAMDPIRVDWQLARDDAHQQLTLTYEVTNTSTKPVVVIDQLIAPSSKGNEPAFDRAVVRSIDADTVAFIRGYAAPEMGSGGVWAPIARTIEPGKKIEGKALIPLPLTAWHNFTKARPLTGTPKKAVLEIGYLDGQEKWGEITLSDGTKARVPSNPFIPHQHLARGEIKTLP